MYSPNPNSPVATASVSSKAAILLLLFIHYLLKILLSVGFCVAPLICGMNLGVLTNFAIPVLRKRELVALFNCVLDVAWLSVHCVCIFLALLVCGVLLCGLKFEYVLSWPP